MDISGANQKLIGAIGGNLIRKDRVQAGYYDKRTRKKLSWSVFRSPQSGRQKREACPGIGLEMEVGWFKRSR
jgi:hypothetical protein